MPEPLFPLGRAAEAAGIDPGFLSQRINRGDPVLDEDRDIDAVGRGSARMFSLDTIVQIAIAERLRQLGIPFKAALLAAAKFVLFGGNSFVGEREAGKPFPKGDTILVHSPVATQAINIHRTNGDTTLGHIVLEALGAPGNDFLAGKFALAMVDAGQVYRQVQRNLGLADTDLEPADVE